MATKSRASKVSNQMLEEAMQGALGNVREEREVSVAKDPGRITGRQHPGRSAEGDGDSDPEPFIQPQPFVAESSFQPFVTESSTLSFSAPDAWHPPTLGRASESRSYSQPQSHRIREVSSTAINSVPAHIQEAYQAAMGNVRESRDENLTIESINANYQPQFNTSNTDSSERNPARLTGRQHPGRGIGRLAESDNGRVDSRFRETLDHTDIQNHTQFQPTPEYEAWRKRVLEGMSGGFVNQKEVGVPFRSSLEQAYYENEINRSRNQDDDRAQEGFLSDAKDKVTNAAQKTGKFLKDNAGGLLTCAILAIHVCGLVSAFNANTQIKEEIKNAADAQSVPDMVSALRKFGGKNGEKAVKEFNQQYKNQIRSDIHDAGIEDRAKKAEDKAKRTEERGRKSPNTIDRSSMNDPLSHDYWKIPKNSQRESYDAERAQEGLISDAAQKVKDAAKKAGRFAVDHSGAILTAAILVLNGLSMAHDFRQLHADRKLGVVVDDPNGVSAKTVREQYERAIKQAVDARDMPKVMSLIHEVGGDSAVEKFKNIYINHATEAKNDLEEVMESYPVSGGIQEAVRELLESAIVVRESGSETQESEPEAQEGFVDDVKDRAKKLGHDAADKIKGAANQAKDFAIAHQGALKAGAGIALLGASALGALGHAGSDADIKKEKRLYDESKMAAVEHGEGSPEHVAAKRRLNSHQIEMAKKDKEGRGKEARDEESRDEESEKAQESRVRESALTILAKYSPETLKELILDPRAVEAKFTAAERKTLAKSGAAEPDGSYPIRNTSDLHNAVSTIGLGGDKEKDKEHVVDRAKKLGATDELPKDWKGSTAKESTDDSSSKPQSAPEADWDAARDSLEKKLGRKATSGELTQHMHKLGLTKMAKEAVTGDMPNALAGVQNKKLSEEAKESGNAFVNAYEKSHDARESDSVDMDNKGEAMESVSKQAKEATDSSPNDDPSPTVLCPNCTLDTNDAIAFKKEGFDYCPKCGGKLIDGKESEENTSDTESKKSKRTKESTMSAMSHDTDNQFDPLEILMGSYNRTMESAGGRVSEGFADSAKDAIKSGVGKVVDSVKSIYHQGQAHDEYDNASDAHERAMNRHGVNHPKTLALKEKKDAAYKNLQDKTPGRASESFVSHVKSKVKSGVKSVAGSMLGIHPDDHVDSREVYDEASDNHNDMLQQHGAHHPSTIAAKHAMDSAYENFSKNSPVHHAQESYRASEAHSFNAMETQRTGSQQLMNSSQFDVVDGGTAFTMMRNIVSKYTLGGAVEPKPQYGKFGASAAELLPTASELTKGTLWGVTIPVDAADKAMISSLIPKVAAFMRSTESAPDEAQEAKGHGSHTHGSNGGGKSPMGMVAPNSNTNKIGTVSHADDITKSPTFNTVSQSDATNPATMAGAPKSTPSGENKITGGKDLTKSPGNFNMTQEGKKVPNVPSDANDGPPTGQEAKGGKKPAFPGAAKPFGATEATDAEESKKSRHAKEGKGMDCEEARDEESEDAMEAKGMDCEESEDAKEGKIGDAVDWVKNKFKKKSPVSSDGSKREVHIDDGAQIGRSKESIDYSLICRESIQQLPQLHQTHPTLQDALLILRESIANRENPERGYHQALNTLDNIQQGQFARMVESAYTLARNAYRGIHPDAPRYFNATHDAWEPAERIADPTNAEPCANILTRAKASPRTTLRSFEIRGEVRDTNAPAPIVHTGRRR